MDLKAELKEMIVRECDKEMDPKMIQDDDILFHSDYALGLDSLDALQISMALQNEYSVRLTDPKELRRIMESINTLADYIKTQQ